MPTLPPRGVAVITPQGGRGGISSLWSTTGVESRGRYDLIDGRTLFRGKQRWVEINGVAFCAATRVWFNANPAS